MKDRDVKHAYWWGNKSITKPVENPIEMETERMRREIEAEMLEQEMQRQMFQHQLSTLSMMGQGHRMSASLPGVSERVFNVEMHSSGEEPKLKELIKVPAEYQLRAEITNRSGAYGDSRKFYYENNMGPLASMEEVPFPNCCGVCILHNFSFDNDITQDQFNDFFGKATENISGTDYFNKAIIYTWSNTGTHERLISNYPQVEILEKFNNPRTGHTISGFEIKLRDER